MQIHQIGANPTCPVAVHRRTDCIILMPRRRKGERGKGEQAVTLGPPKLRKDLVHFSKPSIKSCSAVADEIEIGIRNSVEFFIG